MGETTRREFIKLGLGGSAVLAAASVLPAGCSGYPAAPAGLAFFNAREYGIFKAIADTIVPAGGPNPKSASELQVPENLDRYLAGEPPQVQKDLKAAINIFEYGPILFDLKLTRFTRLSPEEQYRHLESWADSSLGFRRTVFQAFKKAVMFAYYANMDTWQAIGYEGTML